MFFAASGSYHSITTLTLKEVLVGCNKIDDALHLNLEMK